MATSSVEGGNAVVGRLAHDQVAGLTENESDEDDGIPGMSIQFFPMYS